MIIDSCAYIGHYPFRQTKNKTAKELIALMDEKGIDKAVVSSIQGVYYRDMMDGNLELFEEIAPYQDRLIPAANINPEYLCAMEDLERCVKEFGCKEIRLWPRQTDSDVASDEYLAVIKRCGELGVPVAFCLEDTRTGHIMDVRSTVSADELVKVAELSKDTDIVIHNPISLSYAEKISKINRRGRVLYDFGKLETFHGDATLKLVDLVGYSNIMFGSGAPLYYVEPQYVKIKYLAERKNTTPQDLEKIMCDNAKTLYKL